jgi:hypothetical protein
MVGEVPESGGESDAGSGPIDTSDPGCGKEYETSDHSPSDFIRFSNARVKSSAPSRNLRLTTAGAATATWTTERIKKIRVTTLSRRIFAGLSDVGDDVVKLSEQK